MKKDNHLGSKRRIEDKLGEKGIIVLDMYLRHILDIYEEWELGHWVKGALPIPENVPATLGLKVYNEGLENIPRGANGSLVSPKQRETVRSGLKNYIRTFRTMVDRAISGHKPTREDMNILDDAILRKTVVMEIEKDAKTGRFYPSTLMTRPQLIDILWLWVYSVWNEKTRVKRCRANDCNKIFIPKRSDQEYCSEKCYSRQYKRERRALSRNKKITP